MVALWGGTIRFLGWNTDRIIAFKKFAILMKYINFDMMKIIEYYSYRGILLEILLIVKLKFYTFIELFKVW